jgi:hypothetical protein
MPAPEDDMIRTPTMLLATLALVAACAVNPWAVDSFEAPEAMVASKRSFLYKPGEIAAPLVRQPAVATDTEARMRAAIVEELLRKGYVEAADPAGADLVVSYQASGTSRFVESDQRRIGAPSPDELLTPGNVPPPAASELPPEKPVREVAVVVFADEPGTGRLAWRGMVSVETRTSSTESLVRQVVDMARHITQQFPARSAAL